MTAVTSPMQSALQLAQLGYHVFPVQPGGKAPLGQLAPRGHLDATRDSATIRQWFALFPDANIGVALEASGLIDIAPDCAERLADFERRGLPATTIVQSGSGEGHRHYYYRRPADCPALRMCRSGDFDLIADGYAITAPSVTTGPYIVLTQQLPIAELPPAPAWAIAMLREEAKRRSAQPLEASSASGEPPVRLDTAAMEWWEGKRRARDRSGQLHAVAKELYRAGATIATVAAALPERDVAWNFPDGPKYAGRSDAGARYLRTAQVAAADVEREYSAPNIAEPTNDPQLLARIAEMDQLLAALRDEVNQLQQRLTWTMDVLDNPSLQPGEALTALAVINEVGQRAADGQAKSDGFVTIRLKTVAERSNCSESTASRRIGKLAEWGILDKRLVRHERVDYATGEILSGEYITDLQVRLDAAPETKLKQVALLDPERPQAWGGRRVACPDHPTADLIANTTLACAECGQVVARKRRRITAAPGLQLAIQPAGTWNPLTVDYVPMGSKMQSSPCAASPRAT